MYRRILAATVAATALAAMAVGLVGCSKADAKKNVTINVMYKEVTGYTPWLEKAKAQFEAANPGVTVKLSCLPSTEGDYNTKTALTLQTDNTVDVMVVDSFLVASLVAPGNLAELPVADWKDWNEQVPASIRDGIAIGGKVYAIPYTTDTRGLYYNVKVLEKAGVKTPWEPKSWDDILAAVKKLQAAGVAYPIWMNGSKAQGEGTTMQTFEMLMGGTDDWIFEDGKWVVKSKGLTDTLGFIQKLRDMKIYDNNELGTMLDANSFRVLNEKFPAGKEIGIVLDGVWKGGDWISVLKDKAADEIKIVPLPNQKGTGFSSMSGGWTLGVSSLSQNKDLAFKFIQIATTRENMLSFTTEGGDMTVRTDVASDEQYIKLNPFRAEMSKFTNFTKFRPGVDVYPSVSVEIQSAVESVITGQATAEKAAAAYAENVKKIVGEGKWVEKN
jgi:multiple sugar transport system substrate-binding protein